MVEVQDVSQQVIQGTGHHNQRLFYEKLWNHLTGGFMSSTRCKVTDELLKMYEKPTENSHSVHTAKRGDWLSFIHVVSGENIKNNSRWGQSEMNWYFWLGGTDHPNG